MLIYITYSSMGNVNICITILATTEPRTLPARQYPMALPFLLVLAVPPRSFGGSRTIEITARRLTMILRAAVREFTAQC